MFRLGWREEDEEEGQKESKEGGMREGGRNVLVSIHIIIIDTTMCVNMGVSARYTCFSNTNGSAQNVQQICNRTCWVGSDDLCAEKGIAPKRFTEFCHRERGRDTIINIVH